MKFLVRNLLLTIVFYFNFRESNSAGIHGTGSSEPSLSSHNPPNEIQTVYLHYHQRDIQASYRIRNGRRIILECKVIGQHDGIPSPENKKDINFITRALMYDGITYCVVYEKEDGVVLGAKFPPSDDQPYTGNPCDFNPNQSTCFMTYKGLDFKVKQVPHEEVPLKIELLPKNVSKPQQPYVRAYDVKPVFVHFGGLYFVMHKRHRVNGKDDIKIVGADIDIRGPERPRELYL